MNSEGVDVLFLEAVEDGAAVETGEDGGGEEGSDDAGEDVGVDNLLGDDGGVVVVVLVQLGEVQQHPQQDLPPNKHYILILE